MALQTITVDFYNTALCVTWTKLVLTNAASVHNHLTVYFPPYLCMEILLLCASSSWFVIAHTNIINRVGRWLCRLSLLTFTTQHCVCFYKEQSCVDKVSKELWVYTQELVSFPRPGPENKLPCPQTLLKKLEKRACMVSLATSRMCWVSLLCNNYMLYVIMWQPASVDNGIT